MSHWRLHLGLVLHFGVEFLVCVGWVELCDISQGGWFPSVAPSSSLVSKPSHVSWVTARVRVLIICEAFFVTKLYEKCHTKIFLLQVLPTTCGAQQLTSSTLTITAQTRTWTNHYATISLPHHTTPTWWVTSWCHSPEWTCTPGSCRLAAAVSKVRGHFHSADNVLSWI